MITETKEACKARLAAMTTRDLHVTYLTTDSRTIQDYTLAEMAKRERLPASEIPTKQEAIEIEYRRRHEAVSRAQQTYLDDRTPAKWNAYLAADSAFTFYRVQAGQQMMQNQIDRMTPEAFALFRQTND